MNEPTVFEGLLSLAVIVTLYVLAWKLDCGDWTPPDWPKKEKQP